MYDLEQRWRNEIGAILASAAVGVESHREVAVMSEYVEADYHGRFLFELLQNANDQAVNAGLSDSTVIVIRTDEFVAFANEGEPFDEKGVRSITSLGLSEKDPKRLIGNKGIGFKSVFQITNSPEVFSSATQGGSYDEENAMRFRMSLVPFESAPGLERLRKICTDIIGKTPDGAEALKEKSGEDPLEVLVDEVKAAAPFKFPSAISDEETHSRFTKIRECSGSHLSVPTLIVLPLLKNKGIDYVVNNAISELIEGNGASLLFLKGVGSIRIVDQVNDTEILLKKEISSPQTVTESGETHTTVRTSATEKGSAPRTGDWHQIQSEFAEKTDDNGSLNRLNIAARKLPGSNWDGVDSSPVAVALPIQNPATGEFALNADGRICIGLPSKDATGTPAWIHAHFFGTISRKDIDLENCEFNAILFEEAVRLHGVLIETLKKERDLRARRSVTLAFETSSGPLACCLFEKGGPAFGEIVLDDSGERYMQASRIAVFEGSERMVVRRILEASRSDDLGIPEEQLANKAGSLLAKLAPPLEQDGDRKSLFLLRQDEGHSLLEAAAAKNRAEGSDFWRPFLDWVVTQFQIDEIQDQRILPVGENALAASNDRVFLPPANISQEAIATQPEVDTSTSEDENEDLPEEEEVAENLSGLPKEVLASLNFIDPKAVPARTQDGRKYTDLGSKLAPDAGDALVRRPLLDELINRAICPAMESLGRGEQELRRGIGLLDLARRWMARMSDEGRDKIMRHRLMVPVISMDSEDGQSWEWVKATDAYFGPGWLGSVEEENLQEAYGDRDRSMMIGWTDFSESANITFDDLPAWVLSLERMGVSRTPKLLFRSKQWRKNPLVAQSYSSLFISDSAECPIPAADEFWSPYLEECRKRPVQTKSNHPFNFQKVVWIDGLENDHSRSAVVRLVLENYHLYEEYLETELERQKSDATDSSTVPMFWVHAFRVRNWAAIPTNHGLKSPAETWLLEAGHTGQVRKRLETLSFVKPELRWAERILKAVGVSELSEPPINRLVDELDRIARSSANQPRGEKSKFLAMAEDLFERLQKSFSEETDRSLPALSEKWIPMKCSGTLRGILGKEIERAYFDDDPERSKFIPGFREALTWPLQSRFSYKQLVNQLRDRLGQESVIFTREAQVDTGFVADTDSSEPLLDWIRESFPDRTVASDLGSLIAFGGIRDTDPSGDSFKRTWRGFEVTRIKAGTFPQSAPAQFFLEASKKGQRELQVSNQLRRDQILAATWTLVSPVYRDTWHAYSNALIEGNVVDFLNQKCITGAQREEVEVAIGVTAADRFSSTKAAFLAIWACSQEKLDIDRFEEEWEENCLSPELLSQWIGNGLNHSTISALRYQSECDGSLVLLDTAGVTIAEWQNARRMMGMQEFRFSDSEEMWRQTTKKIHAICRASAARSARADLEEMQSCLATIDLETVPESIAIDQVPLGGIIESSIALLREAVSRITSSLVSELLNRRLDSIQALSVNSQFELKIEDTPERDVREYLEEPELRRGETATQQLVALLRIANGLAQHLSETFEEADIREDPRIKALSSGWWANRFCLVYAFQSLLEKTSPEIARQMSEKGLFRSPLSLNEMFARCPDAKPNQSEPVTAPPPRQVQVFGQEIDENCVEEEIANGSSGAIGRMVKEMASSADLPIDLLESERDDAKIRNRYRKRGNGGKGRKPTRGNERDKAITGQIGEMFVYELLSAKQLPGFDHDAWKSENRNTYLGDSLGNDALGYDFQFCDIEGHFSGGKPGSNCLIEVKSSSGDADGRFQMSENEWSRATEAHFDAGEVFVIVLVANVRDAPEIVDIISDPYGLMKESKITLETSDFWLRVGSVA